MCNCRQGSGNSGVLNAIASQLRAGDVVSMVIWDDWTNNLLNSYEVQGPMDDTLLDIISELTATGGTNLYAGLQSGYTLASENFDPERLNRVVLISDGQANVGALEPELIASFAEDGESEAIYLIGVGTGKGYDDTMMDTITDAGKGAYIYIDSEDEAIKMFADRFIENVELAAMNVQLELTLPVTMDVIKHHVEEISEDPGEVEPQHLAPNDAMVFNLTVESCEPGYINDNMEFTATATFFDPFYMVDDISMRFEKRVSVTKSIKELKRESIKQLEKGRAIVTYASAIRIMCPKEISSQCKNYDVLENGLKAIDVCENAKEIVKESLTQNPGDNDLTEITLLLNDYCNLWE